MKNNIVEVLTGAIVISVAMGFLIFAYNKAELRTHIQGTQILAKFDHADGISIGSDVRIAGVKIGSVGGYKLDPKTYDAVVEFNIEKGIGIPKDSSAQIVSDGLLGGKYISITPGAEEIFLSQNDEIIYTQSSVNIENLIGKMVFSSDKK